MAHAWHAWLLGAGLTAGALAGAAEPQALSIVMYKQSFEPASIVVTAGTRITWVNRDDMPHSVTAADNRFDSGPVPAGKSFRWTAQGNGRIDYHCIFHPSMTAVLSVVAADDKHDAQAVEPRPHDATAKHP